VGEQQRSAGREQWKHGGYVQRAYVTRGGRAYYSRTFYAGGPLSTLALSRLTAGADICTTAITQASGTIRDFMVGLPSLGSSDRLGQLGLGDGEDSPWYGFYGGWLESLSGVCCALLLADRII